MITKEEVRNSGIFLKISKSVNNKKASISPKDIGAVFLEYVEYCLKNPIIVIKPVMTKEGADELTEEKPRPFTEVGFVAFMGIRMVLWRKYCVAEGVYEEYGDICSIIVSQIFAWQQENALVKEIDSNLVARLQALADKRESRSTTDVTGPIEAFTKLYDAMSRGTDTVDDAP